MSSSLDDRITVKRLREELTDARRTIEGLHQDLHAARMEHRIHREEWLEELATARNWARLWKRTAWIWRKAWRMANGMDIRNIIAVTRDRNAWKRRAEDAEFTLAMDIEERAGLREWAIRVADEQPTINNPTE
jgi:hypothetical protein